MLSEYSTYHQSDEDKDLISVRTSSVNESAGW